MRVEGKDICMKKLFYSCLCVCTLAIAAGFIAG
jgi:hypothetical protein